MIIPSNYTKYLDNSFVLYILTLLLCIPFIIFSAEPIFNFADNSNYFYAAQKFGSSNGTENLSHYSFRIIQIFLSFISIKLFPGDFFSIKFVGIVIYFLFITSIFWLTLALFKLKNRAFLVTFLLASSYYSIQIILIEIIISDLLEILFITSGALLFLILYNDKKPIKFYFFVGLFFALAMVSRSSSYVYVTSLMLFLTLFLYKYSRSNFISILLLITCAISIILCTELIFNKIIYDDFLTRYVHALQHDKSYILQEGALLPEKTSKENSFIFFDFSYAKNFFIYSFFTCALHLITFAVLFKFIGEKTKHFMFSFLFIISYILLISLFIIQSFGMLPYFLRFLLLPFFFLVYMTAHITVYYVVKNFKKLSPYVFFAYYSINILILIITYTDHSWVEKGLVNFSNNTGSIGTDINKAKVGHINLYTNDNGNLYVTEPEIGMYYFVNSIFSPVGDNFYTIETMDSKTIFNFDFENHQCSLEIAQTIYQKISLISKAKSSLKNDFLDKKNQAYIFYINNDEEINCLVKITKFLA